MTFPSEGVECRGWLYLPAERKPGTKLAAIVCANAITATKEITLPLWAERLAEAGFAVLAFDYRGWGTSAGEPRQHFVAYDQLQDVRNAITWLGFQPEVDPERIGGWGISIGGSHMIYLATFDRRLRAVAAIAAGYTGAAAYSRGLGGEMFKGILANNAADRFNRFAAGTPYTYKQGWGPFGSDCVFPQPEAYEFYMDAKRTVAPDYDNRVTVQSFENLVEYSCDFAIDLASPCAVLLVHGEQDIIPASLARDAFARARDPKKLLVMDCLHSDLYNQAPYFDEAVEAVIEWFGAHLPARETGTPEEEANRSLIARLYKETNSGNLDIFDELCDPAHINHGSVVFPDLNGVAALKDVLKQLMVAVPDLQFVVQDLIAEGDMVAARGTVVGTHSGNFQGIAPPTGKRLVWTGIACYRIVNSKITERWANENDVSLLTQLGVIPPQGG